MAHKLKNILFLDIETISQFPSWEDVPSRFQDLWIKKARTIRTEIPKTPEELYFERAGIFAEFGKVVCVAVGGFYDDNTPKFKAKCIAENTEKETLLAVKKIVEEHSAKSELILCAHNGKEFDFPYLCRRMLVNGIALPVVLDISSKKPWEILHLDTLEFWKFGDYKNYTSLDTLAALFDIPSSKQDLDGSLVNHAYHIDNRIEDIKKYCLSDVVALAQLYLKLNQKDLLKEEQISLG
ncbi:MAG: 3'-5' exonuclease [Leadbetterella sp.]